MALSEEDIRIWNTCPVKKQYAKRLKNYFIGAVLYECERISSNDLWKGYIALTNNLSAASAGSIIKPIAPNKDICKCFFINPDCIPCYVYYWLECVYSDKLGCVFDYNIKHIKETDTLQKKYIEHYRTFKAENKQDIKESRHRRRKLCKMYRDGLHSELFRYSGKALDEFITAEEIETANMILYELYHNQFNKLADAGEEQAISYILGCMQGRAEAERERNINNEQNT